VWWSFLVLLNKYFPGALLLHQGAEKCIATTFLVILQGGLKTLAERFDSDETQILKLEVVSGENNQVWTSRYFG